MIAMQHAGYILGSYAITFAVIGGFVRRVLSRGRQLSEQFDDDDKNWT